MGGCERASEPSHRSANASVICYTLLCGYSPFRSEDKEQLIRETTKGKVIFHERFWKHVSETARDFIRKLLVVEPKDRMSASEALAHPVSRAFSD